MARKQIRVSRQMLFTWFTLAGFIFFFAPQNLTNKFQLAFAHIFRWPLSIGRSISLSTHTQQPLTDVVSRREYNKLQNHLANLTEQLYQEHQKVENLSGMRNRLPLKGAKLVLADVIREFIDGLHSEFTINRGENDGLAKGQFVLGDNSIIGTIYYVSSRTAQVKLVTDSTSKIAVKIAELNRVMQGGGNNSAKIRLLSIKHKVKIGDVVYASKKPGLLDAPMIIGTVAHCKRDDENPSLWDIMIKPACDIEKLNSVAVIIMNPPE
jgi:rod shape-determining protein MreC